MRISITASIFFFAIGGLSLAQSQPTLTGVVNPASNVPPGSPSYGLAQGSIFVAYGTAIGPSILAQAQSLPLPSTAGLAGTSVSVTVNGTTLVAPMVYAFQSQVAGVLPSATPVGTGTMRVTFNGVSASIPITVVASNFGLSTVNQSGGGPAVITRPDYSLVTNATSAKPGEVLVLWGTGLGAITGGDDVIPPAGSLSAPIDVFVGGVKANILYKGRSGAPGLDQINISVPAESALGCAVSLTVQTGTRVGNSTSLPIATGGGQCSDPSNVLSLPPGLNSNASYRVGAIGLSSANVVLSANGKTSTTTTIGAGASFLQYSSAPLAAQTSTLYPSPGSCLVTISPVTVSSTTPIARLNAGPAISLTPVSGATITLNRASNGNYSALLTSLTGGSYQASNGAGGPDIGAFTATFNVPTQPFVWTNPPAATAPIDRTLPLNIQWSGGDPAGFVLINVTSEYINGTTANLVSATCISSPSSGQFTIPANVMLNFPVTDPSSAYAGNSVSVYGYSSYQSLNISGLDLAVAYTAQGTLIGSASFK